MFNKNINNNQKKSCLQKLCALLFLFLVTSCEDYGCIDADDFGEYTTYTFKVESSRLDEYCAYNENANDVDQPIGIKQCISSRCSNPSEKSNCAQVCEDECRNDVTKTLNTISQINTDPSDQNTFTSTSEPFWTSVGGAKKISLEHDSKILITAQGTVDLGNESKKSTVFINKTDTGNEDWNTLRISGNPANDKLNLTKLSGKENINITIEGEFEDSSNTYLGNITETIPPNDPSTENYDPLLKFNVINNYDKNIANGARRLFAYFIPFPDTGKYSDYKFPLAPDPSTWQCSIEGEPSSRYLNCSDNLLCQDKLGSKCDLYAEGFIPSLSPKEKEEYNFHFSTFFNVDNLSKATSRYNNGTGFIRYKDDKLIGADDNLSYKILTVLSNQTRSKLIFDNYQTDYAVKFKNVDGSACTNFKYTISARDRGGVDVDYPVTLGETTYVINKKDLQDIWYSADSGCSAVKVFFNPFHEIEFIESGYIEFGIPDRVLPEIANDASECKLKFKIFNKSLPNIKDNTKDEFANFRYPFTDSVPPIAYREAVEISNNVSPTDSTPSTHPILSGATNNPKKYFIRKGQILSFHPDSWNGKWKPKGVVATEDYQKCGVGFYVKLTPRPAVFCSNKLVNEFINVNQDNITNNKCILYYDEIKKKYTGCQEDISKCTGDKFCPTECIPKNFNSCRASTDIIDDNTLYMPKPIASCAPIEPTFKCYNSNNPIPSECSDNPQNCKAYSYFANIPPYDQMQPFPPSQSIDNSCVTCINSLKNEAIKPLYAKTGIALQQCYDLENYTGTMGDLQDELDKVNSAKQGYEILENSDLKAKGLKKLETLNGNYGNFYPLEDTGKKNADNLSIYKINKLVSVGRAGYLKFIILDDIPIAPGTNPDYFEKEENDRRIATTSPLRVNINSISELSNGEGLTIALCKENSDDGIEQCAWNLNLKDQKKKFNSNSDLVLPITEYNAGSLDQSSNYAFNDFGQLIRQKEIDSSASDDDDEYKRECTSKKENIPYNKANFLCFKDDNNIGIKTNPDYDPTLKNTYRLTFKIFDYETANCKDKNSTYEDCTPASPPSFPESCNKFKIYNQNWNGEEAESGYCPKDDPSTCIKKYRCISDPYANNQGHYDVAVKIKKESKVQISNFIDSIISPILGQVDGFYKTNVVAYQTNQPFRDAIAQAVNANASGETVNIKEIIKKDEKIMYFKYEDFTVGEKLEPIVLNPDKPYPDCKLNCYISYITKANFVYNNPSCNSSSIPSIVPNIKNSCLGSTQCSFLINKNSFKYSNGSPIVPSTSFNNCEITKFYVEYVFSKSDKPLYKENQVRRIYKSILVNPVYKSFLTLSIVLMLSFYGMGFLMGVSELKQSEIVDRLIKIAIIYLFTSPEFGWVWFEKFFVTFFKNGTDFLTYTMAELFDDTNQIELALKAGDFSNKSLIFAGVDRVVQLFLINDVIHKKIGALMFYKFYGILYVMIIYYSAIAYVYAISNAVLIYLTSQFFTSVLFVVGPIFFVFILFKQTKGFFDNWLNALIGFSIQQIFLIFTLSLFNTMLYVVIKLTLGYKVCWESVWQMNLPGGINFSLLSFWTPQDYPFYLGEISNPTAEGSPTSIPTIPRLLSLWTICVIMKSFITTITDLASMLSGGVSATDLGSSVASGMNTMIAQTQKKWGDLYKKSGARVMERVDQKLFNSGDLAKAARKKITNDNSHDNKLKDRMAKSGDKAVSNYKVEKADEYAKLPEEKKRDKLKEIKKNAMMDTAKSMGKTLSQAEALMKDKIGSKYQGDNVFGAMMSIGKDRIRRGGLKSLNEKTLDFDTGMSKTEMHKAIKGTDDLDKRAKFIEDIKQGNIQAKGSKKNISYKERQIAINQLEKSGDIPRLSTTFDPKNTEPSGKQKIMNAIRNPMAAFSKRSADDEEKILERIEKNKNKQSFDGGRKVDPKAIVKLEAFANYLGKKEGIDNKEDQLKAKEKLLAPLNSEIKDVKNYSNEKVREKLEKQMNFNNKIEKVAKKNVDSSKTKLDNIRQSIKDDRNYNHERMDELNTRINNKEAGSSEIEEYSRLKERDQNRTSGDTFEKKNRQRKDAKKELTLNEATLENYGKKGKKIKEALDEIKPEEKQNDIPGGAIPAGDQPQQPEGS